MNTLTFVTLLTLSVVIGGAYRLLGLEARAHLTSQASESDRSVGWMFWWSLDKELYDDEGKRLCRKGNMLALPLLALVLAWYVLLVKW